NVTGVQTCALPFAVGLDLDLTGTGTHDAHHTHILRFGEAVGNEGILSRCLGGPEVGADITIEGAADRIPVLGWQIRLVQPGGCGDHEFADFHPLPAGVVTGGLQADVPGLHRLCQVRHHQWRVLVGADVVPGRP